ncbi:MAG TPA: peptidyl-alpha-hydroxyglycine alpha-amidating lyase family protein [Candidatus Hydrogenedentes bacterium]|nr:peptidyl-alpha-hydroxyglycine alpha-amidating lyase family protein [Candidatus Hydrogenedentota bacterium]
MLLTFASAPAFPASAPPNPEYPRINPAPSYEVVEGWPQKPPVIQWAAMPGVTIDGEGNIWMCTRKAPSVQVYAPDGRYLFGWGDMPGAHHIKIDNEGYVWTSDVHRHVIRKHKRDGEVLLTLGVEGEAGMDERHFFKPTDMAFASNGDIFVTDGYGNARVIHFNKEGNYINAWGSLGTGNDQFSIPHAIVIDSKDRLYIADRNNARVQVYDTGGKLLDSWKHLLVPWGFWITDKDEIWVCGSSTTVWSGALLGIPPKDQLVMKFNTDGKLLELHLFPKGDDGQEKPGELNWVHGIALDAQGNLFLGDINGKRLQKFLRRH